MPLGLSILTFLGLESTLLFFQADVVLGLLSSSLITALVYFIADVYDQEQNELRDNPQNSKYKLPTPQALSIILHVLKTDRLEEKRWTISDIDRNNYSITAFAEWRDDSWREYKQFVSEEPIFRQVKLQIALQRQEYRFTELAMVWTVVSPLNRAQCNAMQSHTSSAIQKALESAESLRTQKSNFFQ